MSRLVPLAFIPTLRSGQKKCQSGFRPAGVTKKGPGIYLGWAPLTYRQFSSILTARMKDYILLINPPAVEGKDYIREGRCMQSTDSWVAIWPPLTLAIFAAIARKYADVRIIDCIAERLNMPELLEKLGSCSPKVIVVNVAFPSIEGDKEAVAKLRERYPNSLILGFGVFFTLLEKEGLEYCPGFDAAIIGEPEVTFEEFLKNYLESGEIPGIPGLMYKKGNQVVVGERREFIEDLDILPYPARDLLDNNLYRLPNNGQPFTLVNTARGCYYPCIFCIAPVYYGKKIRRHSIEYIVKEIECCKRDLGLNNFLFWEEVFTFDKNFCIRLCDEFIKRELKIRWAATTRADTLDLEILNKMKDSGCILLGLGIESGSDKILKECKKGETTKQIKEAVALCKKAGIPTMGHFIFGLPGEDKSTAEESIKYALKLGLDYMQCYCAAPYPKTELGQMAKKRNWITSYSWNDYDFGGKSIINTESLSAEEVTRIKEEAFRRFYFRLGYMAVKIRELKSPRRILNVLNFTRWMCSSSKQKGQK